MGVPGRALDHRPVRGPAAEPRQRDRPPELRDVELVHQPGDRADRAVRPHRRVREARLHAAQAPRREGRAAAPRRARGAADRADRRARRPTSASRSRARTSPTTTATSGHVRGRSAHGARARRRRVSAVPPHDVADLALAAEGEARIAWAAGQMPVLAQIAGAVRRRAAAGRASASPPACTSPPRRRTWSARCIAGGATVALCSANPLSTQDDVAAALVLEDGVEVRRVHGEDSTPTSQHIAGAARRSTTGRRSRSTTAPICSSPRTQAAAKRSTG